MEQENQKGIKSKPHAAQNGETEQVPSSLQEAFQTYRNSIYSAAERPDAFWVNQRAGIEQKIRRPVPAIKHLLVFRWVPAAIVVLLCLSLFMEDKKLPMPDFAGGADQELLIEVERALSREYPVALAPAAILDKQIEPHAKNRRE
jgi:hypothetical protein